jgi:cytochrome d ubiquinol oxidase subunit I
MVVATIVSPFLANASGWIFTEMGRQPWVVAPNFDGELEVRLLTSDAVSQSVGSWSVFTTLTGFTLVYGALGIIEIFLLRRYVKAGPDAAMTSMPGGDEDDGGEDDDGEGSAKSEQFAFAY